MAAWLGRQIIDIGGIHHSGKKRAAQTAEIFATRLAPEKGVKEVAGLNPNDDVQKFADKLQGQEGVLMIVGHLPFLGKLAGLLVTGDPSKTVVSFVNSGVVCLEGEQGDRAVSWYIIPAMFTASSGLPLFVRGGGMKKVVIAAFVVFMSVVFPAFGFGGR